jgi:hypothetical protein
MTDMLPVFVTDNPDDGLQPSGRGISEGAFDPARGAAQPIAKHTANAITDTRFPLFHMCFAQKRVS